MVAGHENLISSCGDFLRPKVFTLSCWGGGGRGVGLVGLRPLSLSTGRLDQNPWLIEALQSVKSKTFAVLKP